MHLNKQKTKKKLEYVHSHTFYHEKEIKENRIKLVASVRIMTKNDNLGYVINVLCE